MCKLQTLCVGSFLALSMIAGGCSFITEGEEDDAYEKATAGGLETWEAYLKGASDIGNKQARCNRIKDHIIKAAGEAIAKAESSGKGEATKKEYIEKLRPMLVSCPPSMSDPTMEAIKKLGKTETAAPETAAPESGEPESGAPESDSAEPGTAGAEGDATGSAK